MKKGIFKTNTEVNVVLPDSNLNNNKNYHEVNQNNLQSTSKEFSK